MHDSSSKAKLNISFASTFLLFYIFTVPFALLSDISSPYMHLLVIFFLTYGFVGLEIISIEMDDPFGGEQKFVNIYFLSDSSDQACSNIT